MTRSTTRSRVRALARTSLLGAGVLLVALAALTLAARLLLPLADGYRGEVEARLAERLGRPVEIGELGLRWRARGPELRLLDVALAEAETAERDGDTGARPGAGGREAAHGRGDFRFDELLLGIDLFASVARGAPIIDELTLVGAELALVNHGGGRVRLDGFDEASDEPRDPSDAERTRFDLVRWMIDARRISLVDTTVTLSDARVGLPLTLAAVNLSAENDGTRHRLRAALSLPAALGGSVELGADLRGLRQGLARVEADLYARGADLQTSALREAVQRLTAGATDEARSARTNASPGAPLALLERLDADARIELWVRWRDGAWRHARARLDARELALRASEGSAPARRVLDTLSADLAFVATATGFSVEADRVELAGAGDRATLESVELARGPDAGDVWRLSAEGDRLPFGLLAHLPAVLLDERSPEVARTLATLAPGGALLDWRSRLAFGAAPRLALSGTIDDLSLEAGDRWPGVDSLDGAVRIADNRGRLTLEGKSFALARDGAALDVDTAGLVLDIDAGIPGQMRVDGRGSVRRGGLEATLRAGITLAEGHSPHVDAQGRYAIDDVSEVAPWLPIAGVPGALERWLGQALIAGRAEAGSIEWVGRLADFPHDDPDRGGGFHLAFDVVDGELAFLPDWPTARIPAARVEIDGRSLSARSVMPGGLDALSVRSASVRVDDLTRPVLGVELSGEGALQSLVEFANGGPLARFLRPVLEFASATGRAGLDLALEAPLYRGGERSLTLDGSLFLGGNDLHFGRADLTFRNADGAVGFDESGVRVSNLRASLFGRPVTLNGESAGEGENALTEIELGGAFEASDVLSHYGIPLDRFVRGASHWTLALSAPHSSAKVRRDGVRLLARSDLVGTQLLLPAPLEKSSGESVPITVSTSFRENAPTTRWRVDHGERLRAALDVDADGLRALGLRFGDGPVTPPEAPGVRLDGHAPALAFDGWATALATLIEDLPESDGEPVPILPIAAELSTDALVAGVSSLGPATFRVSSDERFLNALVDNAHLAGRARWPREHWRRDVTAEVRLRHVDRVFIDALASGEEGDAGASGEDAGGALDPRLLPAIEARIARLVWDELALEDVSLTALPVPLGMTFETSTALGEGATLRGSGTWRVRDADVADASRPGLHASALAIVLSGDDLGAALAFAGLPDVLAEGRGRVRAELAWRAPLYLPALERAGGSLAIAIERGRIVPIEPGAARLVGLFALQAIPRRLSLDFRDVTSDGLAFERIDGDIALSGGIAEVTLQMSGPIGIVDIAGTSDLTARRYDQEIAVLPRVSAALPIIGMISGGATAGIGALVAGGFLKALGIDLDRIGLRRYALRGSWDEPRLESLGALPRRSP